MQMTSVQSLERWEKLHNPENVQFSRSEFTSYINSYADFKAALNETFLKALSSTKSSFVEVWSAIEVDLYTN